MECLLGLARQGARVLLGLERDTAPADPPAGSGTPTHPKTLKLDLGGGVALDLLLIPAGEFMEGAPPEEVDRTADEGPLHKVRISRAFYLGKYEVTQAQWQAVIGTAPSAFKGDARLPVEQVSWDDGQDFCRKLAQRTGRAIRLPTEAEWEYACRAGTTTPFGLGGDDLAGAGQLRREQSLRLRTEGREAGQTDPGGEFQAERLGSVRYARQRVGVVCGLV